MTIDDATQTLWDAVVIGTGIGGGTIGRVLAEAGQKVLFLEQGAAGLRAEETALSDTPLPEARLTRGLWPTPLHVTLNDRDSAFFAPIGAGVGGSSVFYAATLERPERHDLEDRPGLPHPTGGWPVRYDEMAPWFAEAARLFRLYGSDDPLSPEAPLPVRAPPTPTEVEAALHRGLTAVGLHPYHAHTALERVRDCRMCLGHKCPRQCKMDGRSAGVEPALVSGARLLDRARVTRLLADANRVTGIEAQVKGQARLFRARRVILAGGALGSPRLLLASRSGLWPDGLANRSGLVGRNLMFHVNLMLALWPPRGTPPGGVTKAIAFRDLYHAQGNRFGTVQAMGIPARYGEIVHYLSLMLARSRLAHVPGLAALTRLPAALAARLFGEAQIMVGLMEDLPYAENRVTLDPDQPDRLHVEYRFRPELIARHRAFRRALRRALRGQRHMFLGLGPELNFGHPCGTLRFGTDPARSVLRPDCRAHDLENLWVVDASFMPTSMGVNPSLTIAANALRVGAHLKQEPMP